MAVLSATAAQDLTPSPTAQLRSSTRRQRRIVSLGAASLPCGDDAAPHSRRWSFGGWGVDAGVGVVQDAGEVGAGRARPGAGIDRRWVSGPAGGLAKEGP